MTRELRLDFDGPIPCGWEQRLTWALWQGRRRMRAYWCRRTRHGWHVGIVLTRAIADWEAVAWQAVLGSDWRREVFNIAKLRGRLGSAAPWNVLYVRKFGLTL